MYIYEYHFRARNSVLFTPAESQEDITVLSSEESDLDEGDRGAKKKTDQDDEEEVRFCTAKPSLN